MTTKQPIRVIKRSEREAQETDDAVETVPKKTAQEAARDMVANVSGWVNEFQQRRRSETAHAIKTLLPSASSQPSKA